MKKNSGITMITLIITIIVIILIASITIYSGLDTVDSIRTKEAKDATNAIYLALIANEDIVPSGSGDGKSIADYYTVTGRALTNEDFELLGLDYTTDNCKVVFDKNLSGESKIIYNFTYTDDLNRTYDNLVYSMYIEKPAINTKVEFDNVNGVNRPIFIDSQMVPLGYNNEEIENSYNAKWYSYEKNMSRLATATYNGKTFVWIPRFAYKIQDFYAGKSYEDVPNTALDIVFLRDNTDYMSNNEVLPLGYTVHPAFGSGEAGFWIATETISYANSISIAVSDSMDVAPGYSYLVRNSEYAAAAFLSKYLGNKQIVFENREWMGAICGGTSEDFDVYSTYTTDINYISNVQGHALLDTPWDLTAEPTLPNPTDSLYHIVRHPAKGGIFYYEAVGTVTDADYRVVLKK